MDCDENAYLYCGFNRDVTKEEVAERIQNNTILEVLNKIFVKKGDVIFVPAGTVHAIGAGILICEIQQSSDCTYRLYDYERKDKYGNLRELHINKALDVINYNKYVPQILEHTTEHFEMYEKKVISSCKYFECMMYCLNGKMELPAIKESFTSVVCLSGNATMWTEQNPEEKMKFSAGESIFIPKSEKSYYVEGNCELIITRI
jgi:mannose-6-phosphate isomerase class I